MNPLRLAIGVVLLAVLAHVPVAHAQLLLSTNDNKVALVNGVFPVYAHNTVDLSEGAIGVLFLVNSLLIVGGQLPVARAVDHGQSQHRSR